MNDAKYIGMDVESAYSACQVLINGILGNWDSGGFLRRGLIRTCEQTSTGAEKTAQVRGNCYGLVAAGQDYLARYQPGGDSEV
jgi:hypothetical protein